MSTTATADAVVTKVTDWFGFDLSKVTSDWSWRKAGSEPADAATIRTMSFEKIQRTREAVRQWYEENVKVLPACCKAGIVMEATSSYSLEVAAWLRECDEDIHLCVITPKTARRYADLIGMSNKTDEIDARVLACFGADRRPAALDKPDAATALLRPFTRALLGFTENRTCLKQQRTELNSEHLDKKTAKVLQGIYDKAIAELDKQMDKIQAQIDKVLKEQPALKAMVDLLDAIHGVGPIIASTIVAELGDLRRFTRSRQLAAFAGLNPVVRRSGTSVKKRTRMSKCGSSRARRALYLSAMSNSSQDNPFGALYRKLIGQGMQKMAAMGVVMRRTLIVMRAVLKTQRYDPALLYTRWNLEPGTQA